MDDDHAPMAEYTALIEQLCAKRSALVQAMAANPDQITDEQIRATTRKDGAIDEDG